MEPAETDLAITAVTTIRCERQPNVLWVQLTCSTGEVGLGETWFGVGPVETHIHDLAAPYLLGADPGLIRRHQQELMMLWSRKGVGAEARAASAVEVALWDLVGKVRGLPIHRLLGGASRDRVPVYNTCVGPGYMKTPLAVGNDLFSPPEPGGRHEDMWATVEAPGDLARDLLDSGIRTMKILPFDARLAYGDGDIFRLEDLERGLRILAEIRGAVGNAMEIAIECRGRWNVPAAKRMMGAIAEFEPVWVEDPIRNENAAALADVRAAGITPIAAGESLGIPYRHLELIEAGAADIVLTDVVWNGGIGPARTVCDLASLHLLSAGLHDCTGPVGLAASVHLALHHPATFGQEIVRAYLHGWYEDVAVGLPTLADGEMSVADAPGHGVELLGDFLTDAGTTMRTTTREGV